MDSSFLKETVGDALSSACAACCVAQPTDPVSYVGEWLLNYVESDVLVQDFKKNVAVKIASEAETEEELLNRGPYFIPKFTHSAFNSIPEAKTFADVFSEAANEIVSLTEASACYFGVIADQPPPEAELPDDLEEGSIPVFHDTLVPAESTDGGQEDGSGGDSGTDNVEDATDATPNDSDATDAGANGSGEPEPTDYSNSTIEYVSVSAGSSSLKNLTLTSDAGITFKLLDSEKLFLYVPNVMYQRGVKFFNGMPRVGSYMAVKLFNKSRSKAVALLCADTLMPLGSGNTIPENDMSTISACARALQRALDGMSAPDVNEGVQALKELTDELSGMTQLEFEEPTSTSEELSVAMKRLDFIRDQHTKISTSVQTYGTRTVDQLLSCLTVPTASYKVVQAIFEILGKDIDNSAKTWYVTRSSLSETLLEEILAHDAAKEYDGDKKAETDMWIRVWKCIQDIAVLDLHKESIGGALLLKWVFSARNMAAIAAEVRDIEIRMEDEKIAAEEAAKAAAEEANEEDGAEANDNTTAAGDGVKAE